MIKEMKPLKEMTLGHHFLFQIKMLWDAIGFFQLNIKMAL